MNSNKTHITYLDDADGTEAGVQLSPELWNRVQKRLLHLELSLNHENNPFTIPEPLKDLEELKSYWDFKFPYNPDVKCDNCGSSTMDWENDPSRPFYLTNANVGGLLVFKCMHCQSTIRKMHFKDHIKFETKAKKV